MRKHQLQPNGWSCLATAFAICLDVPVKDIFKWLGHDGSEIIYEDVPEPYCRRSFHPQELIDYCYLNRGIPIMQIENEVQLINAHNESLYKIPLQKWRIKKYLQSDMDMVLSGQVKDNGRWHAVANVNGVVYDPNGSRNQVTKFLSNFDIHTLFFCIT